MINADLLSDLNQYSLVGLNARGGAVYLQSTADFE